jgi:cell division GTPase FtsZ
LCTDSGITKTVQSNKIQLGVNLTEGLSAGANPDVNNNLLLKVSLTSKMLDRNTKMVLLLPEWVVVAGGMLQ